MKNPSGWVAARGQIAWILALLISTGIVIQLERLDLGSRLGTLEANPFAEPREALPRPLEQARARAPDPASAAAADQAALLLALSLAALQRDADRGALSAEAAAAVEAIEAAGDPGPLVNDALTLTRRVFGL